MNNGQRKSIQHLPADWDIMPLAKLLQHHLSDLSQRYHISSVGVFGSYVRNEHTPTSDLDVLVAFSHLPSLFTEARIQNDLSQLVDIPVDLVLEEELQGPIGQRILDEVCML